MVAAALARPSFWSRMVAGCATVRDQIRGDGGERPVVVSTDGHIVDRVPS
jgi:hypothetical protein